jgi:hypothetical protein
MASKKSGQADPRNEKPHKGPRGDLDDEDMDFSDQLTEAWSQQGKRSNTFTGHVTPGLAPERMPGGDVNPDAGKDSEAIAQKLRRDRQRIDLRNRARWRQLLDAFPFLETERRPRRWVLVVEIHEWRPSRDQKAIYSELARAVANGSFTSGDVHWLPESFNALRAEGLRHPQLRMTRHRIGRLALIYSPGATGAEAFDDPDFHRDVVSRLVISPAAYRRWRRDNGKYDDLPPKFGAEVEDFAPAGAPSAKSAPKVETDETGDPAQSVAPPAAAFEAEGEAAGSFDRAEGEGPVPPNDVPPDSAANVGVDTGATDAPATPPRFLTSAELDSAYLARICEGRYPTVKQDEAWRREIGLARPRMRKLRAKHRGPDIKKGGAPKSIGKK